MAKTTVVTMHGAGRGCGAIPTQGTPALRATAWTLAAAILGASDGPAVAQDMSWADGVREDGWGDGRVTADGGMVIFRRPAPKGPEGYPRLQLRYEYRDGVKVGAKTYLSLLALDEYDCKGGRFRNLRTGAFTRHNAEGEMRQDPATAPIWSKPAPGTVDAKSLAAACGAR